MDEARSIGDLVRAARKRRDLTQQDLARLAGVSVSLVTKLEQGAYGAIRLETVHKLAVALQVPTSALAGRDAPVAGADERERWEPVRRALDGGADGGQPEAAVRDNQAAEAADALRLAGMAAAGTGADFLLPYSPWHVFGPVTVSVAAAETAMISDRPGEVLAIARQLGGSRLPVPRYAPSHRLDVAAAHAALRQDTEAIGVLTDLRRTRPEWLPQQRYAADTLDKIIRRRRTLTPEMRDLVGFLRLPL